MRFTTALASALCLSALVAPAAQAEGTRQISGSVTYLARIALPPDAVLLVEARSVEGRSLAHQVIETPGAQVPLSYTLDIPVSTPAVLTAAIQFGNGARWVMDPVTIDPDNQPLDLGEAKLHSFSGLGMNAAYLCGESRVTARAEADSLLLNLGVPSYPQILALAADGAGGFTAAEGSHSAKFDGKALSLTTDGAAWPGCDPVPPQEVSVWSAKGEGWQAAFAEGQVTLTAGEVQSTAALPEPLISGPWLHYALNEPGAAPLVLSVSETRCTDAAGLSYPQTTELSTGEQNLPGCGGDPKALLGDAEWKVEAIRGEAITEPSVPTMIFASDLSLFGAGSCNRYTGGYSLTETGLSLSQIASTMMACGEGAMSQERNFFEALSEVTGFGFSDDGALVLKAGETELLRARR